MVERIRVALVDDHHVVRRGLRTYLESFPDLEVVGEAASGEEALRYCGVWSPDVIVMDLLLPGGMDGVEAIRRLRQLNPPRRDSALGLSAPSLSVPNKPVASEHLTQIIALTSYTDDARVMAVLRAGAIGYVRKDAAPDILLAAIRAAARGESLIDPGVASVVLRDLSSSEEPEVALSERELDVLRQVVLGRTNREIAEAMMVGPETVKSHVGNILAKLHLAHRTQVVVYALKHGLISLDDVEL
jgi:NarL family two-component system response regulator LiaR